MIVPPEYAAGCTEPLTLGSKLVLLAIVAIVAGVVVSLIVSALTSSSPIRTATFLVVALVVGAVVWPKLDDIRSFCSGKNEYEQLYNREMAQYDDSVKANDFASREMQMRERERRARSYSRLSLGS